MIGKQKFKVKSINFGFINTLMVLMVAFSFFIIDFIKH